MKCNLSVVGVPISLHLSENEDGDSRRNLDVCLDVADGVQKVAEFFALPVTQVAHGADRRVLCVLQREFAIVGPVVDVVGCDDLTNTVVLFAKLGDYVACAHFDEGVLIGTDHCGVKKIVSGLEEVTKDVASPLLVWIVGGFEDDKRNSANVLGLLLAALNSLARSVDLQLVCSEKRNDVVRGKLHFPVIMGAAYVRSEQRVVPAHFTHLGPGVGIRAALAISGVQRLTRCYNNLTDEIELEFEYLECDMATELLQVPDEFLLQNVAGCPNQEPPRFLATLRSGLKFLLENPDHTKTFANGPVRYKRGPLGAWIKAE